MIRDKEIWSKTPSEKAALKEAKHKNKTILTSNWCGSNKNYSIPLYDKVIIYDKKHISKKCWLANLPTVLSNYPDYTKYFWNGKWYKKGEIPSNNIY